MGNVCGQDSQSTIVAAETPELAEDAVDAIVLEYEELPHITNLYEALDPNPEISIDPSKGQSVQSMTLIHGLRSAVWMW